MPPDAVHLRLTGTFVAMAVFRPVRSPALLDSEPESRQRNPPAFRALTGGMFDIIRWLSRATIPFGVNKERRGVARASQHRATLAGAPDDSKFQVTAFPGP